MTKPIHQAFSVIASLVVVAVIVWGIVLVGSPQTLRLQRFDQQRLEDLQTIHREIQSLCHDPDIKERLKRPLPETIEDLSQQARHRRINLTDPETGQPYTYVVTAETTYELCAIFSLERDWDAEVFWNHPSGKHCFTINALDPP